jgi:hypothetical protein
MPAIKLCGVFSSSTKGFKGMAISDYAQTHAATVFFASCASLIWIAANYTYPADITSEFLEGKKKNPKTKNWRFWVYLRSLVAAILIGWMGARSYALGLWTIGAAIGLPLIRSRVSPKLLAETEILGNICFGSGLALIAHLTRFVPTIVLSSETMSRQVSAILLVISINLFTLRGGTYIVRGVLEKGRILPARMDDKIRVDIEEYNRGRIIGNIERLILTTFISIHAYSSLAFLMAAKGLFRAKDLEQKDFSEYFLTGTLMSSLVAIAAGLLVQLVINVVW